MNDNETNVIQSEYDEEWYQRWYTCANCKEDFMTENTPKYCPSCGKKIASISEGNIKVFRFTD